MLKGIPSIISPHLLMVLDEMGHRDEILIADRNFPARSMSGNLVRLDGHDIPSILKAILAFFPLDGSLNPVTMERADMPEEPPIWAAYRDIVSSYDRRTESLIKIVPHDEFYSTIRKCYAVVATGERALYGNIILKKGLVLD